MLTFCLLGSLSPEISCFSVGRRAQKGLQGKAVVYSGQAHPLSEHFQLGEQSERSDEVSNIPQNNTHLKDSHDFRHHGSKTPGGVEARSILPKERKRAHRWSCSASATPVHTQSPFPVSADLLSPECSVLSWRGSHPEQSGLHIIWGLESLVRTCQSLDPLYLPHFGRTVNTPVHFRGSPAVRVLEAALPPE